MKGCIYCGKRWRDGDVCPNCGRPVDPPAPNPARGGVGKPGTVWIVLALVFGLGVFGAIASHVLPKFMFNAEREKRLAAQREKGIFESGIYEVGKDLPAGEYAVVCNGSTLADDYDLAVYKNRPVSEENMLISGTFRDYQLIVLKEGMYIEFWSAALYDMEKHENPSDPFRSSGMYKVGRDLEAGTYTLKKTYDHDTGIYTIYTDIDFNNIITREFDFVYEDEPVQIELYEGEYIRMIDCSLKP